MVNKPPVHFSVDVFELFPLALSAVLSLHEHVYSSDLASPWHNELNGAHDRTFQRIQQHASEL